MTEELILTSLLVNTILMLLTAIWGCISQVGGREKQALVCCGIMFSTGCYSFYYLLMLIELWG